MACSSAVYMDACPGKRLLIILKFETTAHPTLWSSFEPSVYRNWWSKYVSWTSLKSPWNTNGLVSTFFTFFRPYRIIGDSSCHGGDTGTVAWRIVSIFIFASSSIRSLIRNPKVGIAFGLLAKISEYFGMKTASNVGLFGVLLSFIAYDYSNDSRSLRMYNDSSFASTKRLFTGDVLNAPRESRFPWWFTVSNIPMYDLRALPLTMHP